MSPSKLDIWSAASHFMPWNSGFGLNISGLTPCCSGPEANFIDLSPCIIGSGVNSKIFTYCSCGPEFNSEDFTPWDWTPDVRSQNLTSCSHGPTCFTPWSPGDIFADLESWSPNSRAVSMEVTLWNGDSGICFPNLTPWSFGPEVNSENLTSCCLDPRFSSSDFISWSSEVDFTDFMLLNCDPSTDRIDFIFSTGSPWLNCKDDSVTNPTAFVSWSCVPGINCTCSKPWCFGSGVRSENLTPCKHGPELSSMNFVLWVCGFAINCIDTTLWRFGPGVQSDNFISRIGEPGVNSSDVTLWCGDPEIKSKSLSPWSGGSGRNSENLTLCNCGPRDSPWGCTSWVSSSGIILCRTGSCIGFSDSTILVVVGCWIKLTYFTSCSFGSDSNCLDVTSWSCGSGVNSVTCGFAPVINCLDSTTNGDDSEVNFTCFKFCSSGSDTSYCILGSKVNSRDPFSEYGCTGITSWMFSTGNVANPTVSVFAYSDLRGISDDPVSWRCGLRGVILADSMTWSVGFCINWGKLTWGKSSEISLTVSVSWWSWPGVNSEIFWKYSLGITPPGFKTTDSSFCGQISAANSVGGMSWCLGLEVRPTDFNPCKCSPMVTFLDSTCCNCDSGINLLDSSSGTCKSTKSSCLNGPRVNSSGFILVDCGSEVNDTDFTFWNCGSEISSS